MTCYLLSLCDIDQRPGMVAKMDSRCSAKHENAVITENRWPRHSLYWFPILIKHGINVHVLTFIVTLKLSLLFRDVNVSSGGYKHILQGCQCTGLSWVQIVTVVKSRFFPKGKAATHERREYSVCIDRSGTRGWVLFSFGWMAFLIDRTLAFCPLDVCVCALIAQCYTNMSNCQNVHKMKRTWEEFTMLHVSKKTHEFTAKYFIGVIRLYEGHLTQF